MMEINFPTPAEIAATQERMKARGEEARMMSDESDKVEPGHFYTVSRSFNNGDGSWCDNFWEVVTVNGPNAFVRIHEPHGRNIERFFEIGQRAWYLADDAYAARTPEATP